MDIKFFVPFETAKALKEKGYPQEIDADCGMVYTTPRGILYPVRDLELAAVRSDDAPIIAPSYHEVVDWLESKGIRVFAHYYLAQKEWVYVIEDFKRLQDNAGFFATREQALNAGILKALEVI